MAAGDSLGSEEVEEYTTRQSVVSIVSIVIGLSWGVVFGLWLYRANKSVREMGIDGLQYTPGWGIGGFFVPFLNLVRPVQVTQEIWKASDPDNKVDDPTEWMLSRGSVLIWLWWGMVVLSKIVWRLYDTEAKFDSHDPLSVNIDAMIAESLEILAALAVIAIVLKTEERLVRKEQIVAENEHLLPGDEFFSVAST